MNADEKSDKVIVPEKPPNKESLLSAEVVEERTLPKRNIGQTTAVRTQSRAAASSELASVRRVVVIVRLPLRRLYLREEPSALAVHAGICAGGTG